MRAALRPSTVRRLRSYAGVLFAFLLSCEGAPVPDGTAPAVELEVGMGDAPGAIPIAPAGGTGALSGRPTVPFGTNGGSVDFVDVMKQSMWDDTSSLDARGWPRTDNSLTVID